jgi:hypothetical protein
MRFLVDNVLSFRVAELLRAADHDTIHVRDCGLGSASDEQILEYARNEDRIIIWLRANFLVGVSFAHSSFQSTTSSLESYGWISRWWTSGMTRQRDRQNALCGSVRLATMA